MSTILMAILMIALTILFPFIFITRHKRAVKKQEQVNFRRFSDAGAERHLSFSRQDIIKNKIIGFDGLKQEMMIIEPDNNYDIIFFALKEIRECRIEKEYGMTNDTAEDREKILKEIRLVFSFIDNRAPVSILFYSHNSDSIYLMADMEAKAIRWQIAVSKLVPKTAVTKI